MALTLKDAHEIARKFGAKFEEKSKHNRAVLRCDGYVIGSYGISRGSREKKGYDYIPSQIHLTMAQAEALAECNLNQDEVCAILRNAGKIPSVNGGSTKGSSISERRNSKGS